MYTMGIDIGSASSKAVILKDASELCAMEVVQLGTGSSGPRRALDRVLSASGLSGDEIAYMVATGYGRFSIPEIPTQISEISCHAKGIFHLVPSARTIIDIGGQDAKAIFLSDQGQVVQFYMNDKCAAGTGRFLDVMARVLEIPLEQMGKFAPYGTEPAHISSTCTVFAESEVISQLAAGTPKERIVEGVHASIATKTCALAKRGPLRDDIVLGGGVVQDRAVVAAIEKELGRAVRIAPNPQLTGAFGAALFAWEYASKARMAQEKDKE